MDNSTNGQLNKWTTQQRRLITWTTKQMVNSPHLTHGQFTRKQLNTWTTHHKNTQDMDNSTKTTKHVDNSPRNDSTTQIVTPKKTKSR